MIKNYLKIAWRNLSKRRGFALINILGLSLGFGCAILIFLFVQYHMQFDNFHENSDRIYRFNTELHRDIVAYDASVPPAFSNAFRQDYDYAERIAKIFNWGEDYIALYEGAARRQYKVHAQFAEAELFKIFNYPLLNGSHDVPVSEPYTAVITQQLGQRLFGDSDPVGQTFTLDKNQPITIVGVLKDLPKTTLIQGDVFISFPTLKDYDNFVSTETWTGINSGLQCFALLRPGQDVGQIEDAIAGYVKKYRPDSKNVHEYKLQPLAEIHFNSRYSGGMDPKVLWIFSLIGCFILLVASINYINIATAQATYRSREVGVRKVVGSLKGQLFRQFMTETFVIVILALIFGIILCLLILPAFNSFFDLNLNAKGILDPYFLGFAMLLLGLVTLLAGSYPGLLLSRIAPVLALKRKLTEGDAGGYLTRKVLVVAQFVVSIILIIGCLVVSKQMRYAIHSDLGYDRDGVVMIGIPDDIGEIRLQGLKNRIADMPGVIRISRCFASPGAGNNSWGTSVRYNNRPEAEEFNLQVKVADSDYLKTFDLRLLAGRNFYEKDSVDEILVNEDFVQKVGASTPQEVLGRDLNVNDGFVKGQIVGVVADFHDRDFHEGISPIFIAPDRRLFNELAIKLNMKRAGDVLPEIQKEWLSAFPDYVFEYDFLDDRVARLYEAEQRFLVLIWVFSGLATFIGCLGIYGLILFFIIQKTREIGIRKVLGGQVRDILSLIMQDFFKLIALASLIATPIAWYFSSQWLQNYEYKTPLSWWIFIVAAILVMAVTLLTIGYQALRAARLNPVKSLRTE